MRPQLLTVFLIAIASMLMAMQALTQGEDEVALTITLHNASSRNLSFLRFTGHHPSNRFALSPPMIRPGENCVITAEKKVNGDMEGKAVFVDDQGKEAVLIFMVQEQIHFGSPIFTVASTKYRSKLISKTRNQKIHPRLLTYTHGLIDVLPK